MKEHIIANSFDIKLPGDMPWGEGIWNFYVERLVVVLLSQSLCIFPAASYETAEENQVKRRNRLGTTIDQVD